MNDIETLPDQGADFSRTLPLLVTWFFVAMALGLSGAIATEGEPPVGLALSLGAPLLLFFVDAHFGSPLLRGLHRLSLSTLVALQTFRVGGVFFLVAWFAGTLPGAFAWPAGLGDIAVGAAAPFVAAAIARRAPGHRALARGWNILGALDLVTAVTLGVTHSGSSLGVLRGDVTTDAMALYPFSLIPTFLVPLGLILHVLTFRALRRERAG